MRKPKMFGIGSLIFLLWLGLAMAADGTFEDADKAKDYTSGNSNQQFDLRHTIPGEPEVDYPIYSEVPKTSFECTGRHEGYYADVESRCQAFRICAHTARSVHGFGFLCPNGTLFSQKNFVCDWYRNVNCDESEQYYSKNDINRVGSSYDMMERVRQMMEYPMKTVSKALQRGGSAAARRPATTKAAHHTLKKELHSPAPQTANQKTVSSRGSVRNSQRGSARKQAVTRAQVESVQSYNRKDDGTSSSTRTQQEATRTTNARDDSTAGDHSTKTASVEETSASQTGAADSDTESDDVYVNSLGELSTDPGVSFDRTNAHIIAESPRSYHYGKKLNFAEKVNAALNDLVDLPPTSGDVLAPDYVKNMRKSTDEATQTDLASNINGLLDEIAYELDTNASGYQVPAPQKPKHAFKFLSRGFSSQSERAKDPSYQYGKPKQTASTIRFSPNELPVEDKDHFEAKTQKHTNETHTNANENTNTDSAANAHSFENSEETIQFTIMTTTTPAPADETSIAAIDDSYLSEATLPPLDDYSYLSPPLLDALLPPTTDAIDATEVPPYDAAAPNTAQPYIETAPLVETTVSPVFAAYAVTTTPPPPGYEENTTALATPSDEPAAITDNPEDGDDVNALAELKEQQRNVAKHAAQLLLAGVKLTTLDNGTENVAFAAGLNQHSTGELLIRVEDESLSTPAPDTSTDYAPPTTITAVPLPASSTEGGSFSERIRNYRRFATLQRATARPLVYTKRTQPHASGRSATTKAPSTTTASTTTTRSYLKRVAASRLRLSRLAAANRGASSAPATENDDNVGHNNNNVQSSESGKKISVRNIDKELGSAKGYDSRPNAFDSDDSRNGVATWESVRNNLKRYQVNRKPGHAPHTTAAPAATSRATTRNALLRSPNRFANFKSLRSGKESLGGGTTTTSTTSAAPYIPPAAASTPPAPQQSTLQQQLTQTISYDSPLSSPLSSSSAHTNHNNNNANTLTSPNSFATSVSYSTSASSSSKNSPAAQTIPNSLTNAASSSISSELPAATFLSFDKLTRAIVDDSVLQNFQGNYRPSTSSTYQPVAGSFGKAIASSVRPTTNAAALGFGQSQVQAPSQLTASQRPLVLPQVQPTTSLVPTAATPRVLIARAEGQRIEPNSVSSIISALVTQKPKTTQTKPYVPLEDFLTKEFGGSTVAQSHHKSTASTFYAQQQHQQYQSISTQNIQQQQQQVVPTAATYQTSQQQAQQHYQKTTATVPTIFAQQPQQQQQQQQQPQHHQQHQQHPQQQQKQTYHQQHKQQQQTHSQQPQQQQQRHQQYKQQQFLQVATTATTFLAQQLQQQQLRQEQQYQRQQYQKQQLKQQQHFQQKLQYSNTQQQQQQQYTQPQQQQYTQQAARQQQPTYYQTSTTTAKQQQQQQQLQKLPYLPPSQQIQQSEQQQQQQQQLQTQTLAPKFSYSQQQQQYTPQQQHSTSQQQHLSSNITPNIFATFQQQQQLPQFPPLVSSAAPVSPTAATLGQPTPTDLPPEHDVHLNVQLPALPNGLIPAPTTLAQPQTLQKRIDTATPTEYAQPSAASTASTPAANSVYSGASSYDVPLSSIGRLPNDITQLLRRLRKL